MGFKPARQPTTSSQFHPVRCAIFPGGARPPLRHSRRFEADRFDTLNRLTNSATGASTPSSCTGGTLNKTVAYDALGNITSKSDVCNTANCYLYGSGAGPHAVTSISGLGDYSYDVNGNMTCLSSAASCGGTVAKQYSYTQFNMTASVVQGGTALCLTYDSGHSRIAMEQRSTNCSGTLAGTTTYLNDPASGSLSEKVVAGGVTTWHDFLTVDGHIIAQRSATGAGTPSNWGSPTQWGSFQWSGLSFSWAYFTLDNLGSIGVVTDGSGSVTARLSYDA